MDLLLILVWFLLTMGFPLSLIVSSYYVYVRGSRLYDIFGKFLLSLIIYCALTIPTGFLAGLILFIGAHSNPVDAILGTKELLIGTGILVVYLVVAWLANSLIVGHLIWPNSHRGNFSKE